MPKLETITLPDGITYNIDTTYVAGDGIEITGDDNEISVKYGSVVDTACEGNDPRLSDARPASDVYSWAKEPTKPTYTPEEVGAIAVTTKGANGGVAELDSNGKVPASQLPSFVDDVVEGYLYNNAFYEDLEHTILITPESDKIYTDLATNRIYRWGGSSYVETSQGVVLGETSETAYRGDRGKIAYEHAADVNKATTAITSGFYKFAHTSEGHIQSTTPVVKSDITNLGIPGEEQIIDLTRAEYDLLPTSEKNNGKYYHITDEDGNFALDKFVRQIPTTDDENLEVLLGGSAGNTDITTYAKKTDGLLFNPNTNILTTKGDIVASGYTWDGTNTSLQTAIGSINTSLTQLNSNLTNLVTVETISVSTTTNSSVSPYGAYAQIDFTSEQQALGTAVSAIVRGSGSTNPCTACLRSNNVGVFVYSKTAATFNCIVTFVKN